MLEETYLIPDDASSPDVESTYGELERFSQRPPEELLPLFAAGLWTPRSRGARGSEADRRHGTRTAGRSLRASDVGARDGGAYAWTADRNPNVPYGRMDKPLRNGHASIGGGDKPHVIPPLLPGKLIRGETPWRCPRLGWTRSSCARRRSRWPS